MSGGEFTFNQIIPKENFNLTKGDLKVYSYKGDSGTYHNSFSPSSRCFSELWRNESISFCLFPLSAFQVLWAGAESVVVVTGNSVDCYMCPNCACSPYHHQQIMGMSRTLSSSSSSLRNSAYS
jgi:hypothetical protein